MGTRREARERALQFLFQCDINPPEDFEAALTLFWESQQTAATGKEQTSQTRDKPAEAPLQTPDQDVIRAFANDLIRGAWQHRGKIDALITKHAKNWDLCRMAVVDRNILRIAIYEMLYREDIPPVVSINEAVDIAKKYSTEDSGGFVNGILDKIRTEILRPARIVKD
ncbi:MAG TPA: transcription antitermination factor NusB [Verrucomicrobiota bacterium]|nr:transcription antitermination factor NusB [Verrucomicrobiota bacterium]HOK77865.1 transcription antitermination factor NusB [Verrucomicrobiota bacterium]